MSAPLWMRNKVFGEDLMIVDCGYLKDEKARDRVDALRAFGIGKANVRIELMNRLFVSIPPTKRGKVLAEFPQITEGSIYFGSTHHFQVQDQDT